MFERRYGLTYRGIREYEESSRKAGLSEGTLKDRYEFLTRTEEHLGELDQAQPGALESWIYRDIWSAQSQATYYGHLRAYYKWALSSGKVAADPMENIRRPSVPKRIPRPARIRDYEQVMTDAEHRWRIAATLARFAGLRAQEIAQLHRSDVDEKGIRIRKAGGTDRTLPMHPAIWEQVSRVPEGNVVISSGGRPYSSSGISHAFGTRMRQLGILDLTLEKLKHLHTIVSRLDDQELTEILADPAAGTFLYQMNPEAIRSAIASDPNARDLAALAYRRSQITKFRCLLTDPNYFEDVRGSIGKVGRERVWQDFLELNPWILGVGIGGQLYTSWNSERLEQVVRGFSILGSGKRVDALLRTAGRVKSLVFAEIKHHETELLERVATPYRQDCWAISRELAGGIVQIQQTVDLAVHGIVERRIPELDSDGNELGDFTYVLRPRSYLIAGTQAEFQGSEGGMNRAKYHSFELFRRNIYEPEIITFDELLARAEWHVTEASNNAGQDA